jgi:hypothetical protein
VACRNSTRRLLSHSNAASANHKRCAQAFGYGQLGLTDWGAVLVLAMVTNVLDGWPMGNAFH